MEELKIIHLIIKSLLFFQKNKHNKKKDIYVNIINKNIFNLNK